MIIQTAVKRETLRIAIGTALMSVLMLSVFLLLQKLDGAVLLGAFLGYITAVGNFFLMALGIQRATQEARPPAEDLPSQEDTSEEDTPSPVNKKAKGIVQRSYYLRLMMIALMGIAALLIPQINAYAAILSLLFPRILIPILNGYDKKKERSKVSEKDS